MCVCAQAEPEGQASMDAARIPVPFGSIHRVAQSMVGGGGGRRGEGGGGRWEGGLLAGWLQLSLLLLLRLPTVAPLESGG